MGIWKNVRKALTSDETTNSKKQKAQPAQLTEFKINQMNNLIRIHSESIEIVNETTNIKTFFSRYGKALETLQKLETFEKFDVFKPETLPSRAIDELVREENQLIFEFLHRWHKKQKSEILGLKKMDAKEKRVKSFRESIAPYSKRLSSLHLKTHEKLLLDLEEAAGLMPGSTSLEPITPDSVTKSIPPDVLELMWFLDGPLKNFKTTSRPISNTLFTIITSNDEPSVISMQYHPIGKTPDNSPLGYYPSYSKLNPGQRRRYLEWLHDITKPVDIGYVFIFYYGLERHILSGDAEKAVSMVKRLKQYHDNKSFQAYSTDAVVIASLVHRRLDWLESLYLDSLNPQALGLIRCLFAQEFDPDDIVQASKFVGFTNQRYIKNEPALFKEMLAENLTKKHGKPTFPLPAELLKNAPKENIFALANYSLTPEQGYYALPSPLDVPEVYEGLFSILKETHEDVKAELAKRRKENRKKEKSTEEKE